MSASSLHLWRSEWVLRRDRSLTRPAWPASLLQCLSTSRHVVKFLPAPTYLLARFTHQMGAEVPGDTLGDEFKGYLFRITGGNDKQGFPMKQGVLHPARVRLLLSDGHSCYRPRRTGERK